MTEQERQDLEAVRDMFAGIAMQEYLDKGYKQSINSVIESTPKMIDGVFEKYTRAEIRAIWSYNDADTMIEEKLKRLKERKKLNHPANVNETKGIDSMGEWE